MGCGVSSPSRTYTYLCASPLFLHLTETQLQSFAKHFSILEIRTGDALYRQYDVADRVYIIGEGAVQLQVEQEQALTSLSKKSLAANDDWDKPMDTLTIPSRKSNARHSASLTHSLAPRGAGCVLGLEAIGIDVDAIRTATAVAREPTAVLSIQRKKLMKYFEREPELKATILECLGHGMEKQLAELPFLKSVSPPQLSLLASLLRFVPLKENEILFDDGDLAEEGNSMYIVYKGKVKATSIKDGEEIVLNEIGQGRFFGEIGLMIDIPRTARISAVERCLLLELKKKDFQSFLKIANAPLMNAELDALLKKRTAEHFRKYNVPFFSAIPFDKYAVLANLCSIQQLPPSHVLCYEGERAHAFYIIAHGTVEISIHRRVSLTRKQSRYQQDMKEEMEQSVQEEDEDDEENEKTIRVTRPPPREERTHSISTSVSDETKARRLSLSSPQTHNMLNVQRRTPIDMESIQLGFEDVRSHPTSALSSGTTTPRIPMSPHQALSLSPVTQYSSLSTSHHLTSNTTHPTHSLSFSPQPTPARSRIAMAPTINTRPSTSSIHEPIIHASRSPLSAHVEEKIMTEEILPQMVNTDEHEHEPKDEHKPSTTHKWNHKENNITSNNKEWEMNPTQGFDTRQLTIGSLGPGNFFGEASLLTNEPMKATFTCLTRCVILSISAENLKLFFQSCPEAEANFQVKLARYDISLEHLLYHPVGLQYFMTHCQREYSAENIDFWVAARAFRLNRDAKPSVMIDNARAIVREFIAATAINQVNILGTTRQTIEMALMPNAQGRIEITADLFNPAMSEILRLMAADSFIRFKQSILFQEFLQETTEGDTLRDRGFSVSGVPSTVSSEAISPRNGRKLSGKA